MLNRATRLVGDIADNRDTQPPQARAAVRIVRRI